MITYFDFDGNILDNEYFSKSDDNQVNKIKK